MENKNNFKEFLLTKAGNACMIGFFYIVLLAVVTVAVNVPLFMFLLIVPIIYFGWQALSKITPNIFLVMPLVGWVIYFLIKGCLAIFIGPFVMPFVLAKKISGALQKRL